MNHRLVGIVAAYVLVLASIAGETKSAMKPMSEAEQHLLALTRQWVDAETNRDEAMLRRILDDRIVATIGTGKIIDKESYVKAIMTEGPYKMLGHDLTDESVVVEGDTGVVVGTDTIRGMTDGQESTNSYRYTATYIKRDAHWTVLALHMVKIPPAI